MQPGDLFNVSHGPFPMSGESINSPKCSTNTAFPASSAMIHTQGLPDIQAGPACGTGKKAWLWRANAVRLDAPNEDLKFAGFHIPSAVGRVVIPKTLRDPSEVVTVLPSPGSKLNFDQMISVSFWGRNKQ